MFKIFVVGFCLIGISMGSWATSLFDPLDGQLDFSQYLSENAYGFLPVPIIITDPAVGGGLGVVGLFFHEDKDSQQERLKSMQKADADAGRYLLPPSVSAVAVAGTGNDSWFAGGGHMGFFKQGDIRYTAGGGYGDVNLDFYGFGDINLSKPIEIKTKASMVLQKLKFKLPNTRWFLGVSQQYVSAEISPNSLGQLDEVLPPDWSEELRKILTKRITTSSVGLIAEYDSRDNIFTPRQGYQYQLESMWFDDSIGSDIDYSLTSFQGLNFWPLRKQIRLGLKVAADYADADSLLPPYATPSIQLRGIPAMRYQGQFVGMTEAEVVWEASNRWRAAVFAGAGKATNDTGKFNQADTRKTYGVGFRYQIARRYGFDVGIDVARGPEETVWYITAGSAWAGI